jgi:predicted esterase
MNSWFNFNNTFRNEENDGDLDLLQQEAEQEDLLLATESFNELVQDELGLVLNEDPSRIFIAGFSQGASLVLAQFLL